MTRQHRPGPKKATISRKSASRKSTSRRSTKAKPAGASGAGGGKPVSGKISGSKKSGGKSSGARNLKVRVKTARGRTTSSTRWLQRQLNDPYVSAARDAGYRSRAAFKLVDLDTKFKLLKPGMRIVDLGAAPGGWTQYAVAQTEQSRVHDGNGERSSKPSVLAIDINEMEPVVGATVLQLDITDPEAASIIREQLGGKVDLVMSDMASPATGHKGTDHLRVIALCEIALDLAVEVLAPGGTFIAKVFQGGSEQSLLDALKRDFQTVRHAKPKASRQDSSESYVVALGFRGRSVA